MLKEVRAEDAGVCKLRHFKIRTAAFLLTMFMEHFAWLVDRIDITVTWMNPASRCCQVGLSAQS